VAGDTPSTPTTTAHSAGSVVADDPGGRQRVRQLGHPDQRHVGRHDSSIERPYPGTVAELDPKLARAIIATLRSAAMSDEESGTNVDWRATRDGWVDALDPSYGAPDIGFDAARDLIAFLGDSAPSRESRMSAAEWSASVDAVVTRLLSALR